MPSWSIGSKPQDTHTHSLKMPMLSSTQPSSSSNVENLHPQTVRQVLREMTELSQNPPEGIKVLLNEEDITDIQASIEGPGRVDTI